MKNVTLSVDEHLIDAARARAEAEHTILNEQFRRWLSDYVGREPRTDAAMALIEELQGKYATGGRTFTRDELNERR